MNNEKNNGKGIFYGVIGVATLIVAIIGATFAYFTASQTNNEKITGNAATISFGLNVEKITTVDDTNGGLIPMTDGMLNKAVTNASTNGVCVDDTGAAVCQIYKITITNTGSAALFLDGYVNLVGGLGYVTDTTADNYAANQATTMRWAQVFSTDDSTFALNGTPTLATGASGITAFTGIAQTGTSNIDLDSKFTKGTYTYNTNTYDYINKNFMRLSGHKKSGTEELDAANEDNTYTRTGDKNSALVFNQRLEAKDATPGKEQVFYIVVWLSETGTNQTAGAQAASATTANVEATNFFKGNVVFLSAAGGEVSATFNGTTRRPATDNNATAQS